MKKNLSLMLISILFLSACATTEVLNVWKNENSQDVKLSNVLVIGVIKKESYRKLYENLMVTELNKMGVTASASYKLFPNVEYLDKSMIENKINELNMDGVLVAKLIDKKKETVYTPPTTHVSGTYYRGTSYNRGNTWYGYYDTSYNISYSPGYSVEYDIATVETNLYDAKKEGLVWTAITETAETGVTRALESYAKIISKPLAESKLF